MSEFKYTLGTKLRQGLNKYHVVGHTTYIDGSRGYKLSVWIMHGAGNSILDIPAISVEDEKEMKVYEE